MPLATALLVTAALIAVAVWVTRTYGTRRRLHRAWREQALHGRQQLRAEARSIAARHVAGASADRRTRRQAARDVAAATLRQGR